MTARQRKLVNGSIKWLIVIAFTAGGIVFMVKSNNQMLTDHEKRIDECEKADVSMCVKQEAMHADIKEVARKQDKLIEHLMRH